MKFDIKTETLEENIKVREVLVFLGYSQEGYLKTEMDRKLYEYMVIDIDNRAIYGGNHTKTREIISLDEVIKRSIKKTSIKVNLNTDYNAIVTKDNVKVGCQTFTHDVIFKVVDAINEMKEQ